MHAYLPHLLSDIAEAHRDETSFQSEKAQTFEEYIEEVERWLAGEDHEQTFGYYCGLETIDFPPPEQFTKDEIKQVCEAFKHLLFSWNSGIHLPENLPLPLRYKFMAQTLNEGFTPVVTGFKDFDYCTGYAPDCVFKEYCSCLIYWNERDDDMDMPDNTELPF